MANAYKVTAPYVTCKVRDDLGGESVRGFYEGGVLPASADPENVKILVEKGMVEKVTAPEPEPATEPAVLVDEDRDDLDAEPAPDRPLVGASKADWVEFAVTQRADGVSEEDARVEAENSTKAELVARFGG
jgi:hypothetical protein